MRALVALALCLAVQAAAVTAPLVHAHADDHATAHHAARATHAHWSGHEHSPHPSGVPAIHPPDDDRALYLNAFVAVAAASAPGHAAVAETFELPMPAKRLVCRGIEVVRSHDPPVTGPLSSRAPPAFLS